MVHTMHTNSIYAYTHIYTRPHEAMGWRGHLHPRGARRRQLHSNMAMGTTTLPRYHAHHSRQGTCMHGFIGHVDCHVLAQWWTTGSWGCCLPHFVLVRGLPAYKMHATELNSLMLPVSGAFGYWAPLLSPRFTSRSSSPDISQPP